MSISAVIITWNSADYVEAAIRSVRASAKAAGVPVEVIVVDNASADRSREIAGEAGTDKLIENPVNVGFALAANQGIAVASHEWVFMTNPDLVLDDGCFSALLRAAEEAGPEVRSFVPDLRYASNPDLVNSWGIVVDELGIPAEVAAGHFPDHVAPPAEVFGGIGGAWLISRAVLNRVGGFEPAYFAYLEDVDLAWRLQRTGCRTRFVREARGLHLGSSSTGVDSPLKAYLVGRNRRFLFSLQGPHDLRVRARRVVVEAGHTAVQAALARTWAPIRGRMAALRFRPYVRFVAASSKTATGETRAVRLVKRATLSATLRRKLEGSRQHAK